MEPVIFLVFVAIQLAAHTLPEHLTKSSKFAKHINTHHYAVWLMNPAVWHGVKDYVIHIIVYSGYVLKGH